VVTAEGVDDVLEVITSDCAGVITTFGPIIPPFAIVYYLL
jgi:hypothetical protein